MPKIRLPPPNLGTSINRLICLFFSLPWHSLLRTWGFQGGALFLGMLEHSSNTRCKKPKSSCIPDLPWDRSQGLEKEELQQFPHPWRGDPS